MGEMESEGKPFDISKRAVWEAYRKVAENKGAPGVDGITITKFEEKLKNNLFKLWNRMSSGSYFPPPVKAVEIPKSGGGVRMLGVPTVADRIAQTVVAKHLEDRVERLFHLSSFGYRPGRSALDAVAACRRRCWKSDWVLDLDIQKFFDTVDHDLMVKAVRAHTDQEWVVLYVTRWLRAPMQQVDGTTETRTRGTPQGSALSPVLANLFLHYAFDAWMEREYPTVEFERYVDDIVVHCVNMQQAAMLREKIGDRLASVGLTLHPKKTKVVYCKDGKRRARHPVTAFTFLGYDFRARKARSRQGRMFTSFLPAVSKDAMKAMNREVRGWRIHLRSNRNLGEIARFINPIVRGWLNYYGAFYRSELFALCARINTYLVRWARKKYRRLGAFKRLHEWWRNVQVVAPRLFYHWSFTRDFLPTGW